MAGASFLPVLLGLFVLVAIQDAVANCPNGYMQSGINSQCYKVIPKRMAYKRAKGACRKSRGHVAAILTADDNSAVCDMIPSKGGYMFIGLVNNRWPDGSKPTYKNYEKKTKPKKMRKRSCTAMDHMTCKWKPSKCSHKRGVVCAADPTNTVTQGPTDYDDMILVVAGGYNNLEDTLTSEIVPIGNPSLTCPGPQTIPFELEFGTHFTHNGLPVICSELDGACVKLDPSSMTWASTSFVISPTRYGAVTAQIGGKSVIAGGYSDTVGEYIFDSVIWDEANEQFITGPAIASTLMYKTCMAAIDSDTAIIVGVEDSSNGHVKAYKFQLSGGSSVELPDLPGEIYDGPACGMAKKSDGSMIFVAAGGRYVPGTTYILDLANPTSWTTGPNSFPTELEEARSIPYKDTFLVVGGEDTAGDPVTTIYEFDADAEDWIVRMETLATARENMPALFFVDKDLVCT